MATKSNDPVDMVMNAFDQFKNSSDDKWKAMQTQLDHCEMILNRTNMGGGGHSQVATASVDERRALAQLARTGDEAAFMNSARTNGLMIGDDPAGGYLVSPAVSTQIVSALRAVSPMRRW
nr:phage major capsid protein [uncultured Duganella sp.]